MILKDAVDLFLSEQIATTRESYRLPMLEFIEQMGAKRDINSISQQDLIRFKGHMKNRLNKRTGKPLANATKHKYFKNAKVFLSWCVNYDYLPSSPAAKVKNLPLREENSYDKAMTDAEIEAIVKYLLLKAELKLGLLHWRDLAMFLFFHDTGCRRGGLSTLTMDRLDLASRQATVIEKGGHSYPVYFGELCAQAIAHWLEERSIESEWVFSSSDKQWLPYSVGQQVRRICDKAQVKRRSPHSIRHHKGVKFAEARVSTTIAAEILNHSSTLITTRYYYAHSSVQAQETAREFTYQDDSTLPDNVISFRKIAGRK